MKHEPRQIRPAEFPALISLWQRTFGDSEPVIRAFFRLLPDMGLGVTAERDGRILGMAYAVTGLELVTGDKPPQRCGYIYAVAVEPDCRGLGLGRALTVKAAELSRERGAEIICTLPAEPGLYPWYESIIGVQRALDRRTVAVKAVEKDAALPCAGLDSAAYGARRETLLEGRAHLRLNQAALEFQRQLCAGYGGGFFACGGGIAAAYADGEQVLIRELLCTDPAEMENIAASVAAELGVNQALVYLPARPGRGEGYIAAEPGAVPEGCHWGLSFD